MSAGFAVIIVDSTSHALRIEKLFVNCGLPCKLIPVPRHLSSDCGVCVRINQQDMNAARDLLDAHQIIAFPIEVI